MAEPAHSGLPPFSAQRLGTERAKAAAELRKLFHEVGLAKQLWPSWVDVRPGLLTTIWANADDEPPLGQLGDELCTRYGQLLLDGLAALKLACAAPEVGICSASEKRLAELRRLSAQTAIAIRATPDVFPSLPEADLPSRDGRVWAVSALTVAQVGALVSGLPPLRLCSVVGAVTQPLVLDLHDAPSPTRQDFTPRDLVRRCAGASAAAWVAVAGGALSGTLWDADEPLPSDTNHLLILPADHALLRRHKLLRNKEARIANACLSCDLCSGFCPDGLLPHTAMRALRDDSADRSPTLEGCHGCGACSVVCPADLLPSVLLVDRLVKIQGQATRVDDLPAVPSGRLRIPTERMLARLGLLQYQRR